MSKRLKDLLEIFDEESVRYVHWKSNLNIDKALTYDDDFDILVSQEDKGKVLKILSEFSFFRGLSKKDKWQNEIFHYYGIDLIKLKIIHFHLHFLLEIGHDYDKRSNLHVVENYLDNRQKYRYTYLPEFEKEYILLVIRIFLKNDFKALSLKLPHAQIRSLLNYKNGVAKGGAYREFLDLKNKINIDRLKTILASDFSFIEKDFFCKMEQVIDKNNSLSNYFGVARKLNKKLKKFNNHSVLLSFWLSFKRINFGRISLVLGNNDFMKKRNISGGRIFVFVGGDGAGKSTNIDKLYKLLKKQLYTKKIHIGRPKKFFLGTLLRILSKVIRILQFKDVSLALSYLALAHDRYKYYKFALKLKGKGCIVLLDRFPIRGIDKMDCPRIHQHFPNKYKFFSKEEKKYHKKINYYDKLFVLKLNPEIAIQRRPEDDAEELRLRSGQIWSKDFSDYTNAVVVNTNDSFEVVERKILSEVWTNLHRKTTYELVGVAASGKSTVRDDLEGKNYTFNPSVKKIDFFRFFIRYFWKSIAILLKTKQVMYLTTFVYYKVYLEKIRNSEFREKGLLFFDQGPIFMATILSIEIPKMKAILFDELKKNSPFFKCIIYLEAPRDVLLSRIENRSQDHRIKKLNKKEMNTFLDMYLKVYEDILAIFESNGVNIIKINTHLNNIDQVKRIIEESINRE
jgi:thymidylate kinase